MLSRAERSCAWSAICCVRTSTCPPSAITCAFCEWVLAASTASACCFASAHRVPARMLKELSSTIRSGRPLASAAGRRINGSASAGVASSSACRARRTSGNSLAVVWSHAFAADAQRPARSAQPGLPETTAQEIPSVSRLPQRKVFAQRSVERLVGYKQLIVHPRCLRTGAKLFNVRIDLRSVGRFRVLRYNFDLPVGFKINQQRGSLQHGPYLLRIEDMKQHYIVAMEA